MISGDNYDKNFEGAIVKVVAFFDMFDYPLTLNEIWRFITAKCEISDVANILNSGLTELGQRNGFYFLSGREQIVGERLRRYNFANRKFKRAMRAAKIFRFIPWVKMIAVGNLLGAQNLRDDSDIDLLIITENRRIWLSRFFCVGIAKLLGWRPRAGNSRDKICLSFYLNQSALALDKLMLDREDWYLIYWLACLTPVYDNGGLYNKLITDNQQLINYLPNWSPVEEIAKRQIAGIDSVFYRDVIDLFIGGLEPQARNWQLKILPVELREIANKDSRVVINDQVIKLHANDRREEFKKNYELRIKNYEMFK